MYPYLATLIGVIIGAVSMIYAAVRSLLFAQSFRSHRFISAGNFTAGQFGNFTAREFGNFTGSFNGPPRFASVNPYGGFVNELAIIAAIIALVGTLWLGFVLNRQHRL